MTHDRRRADIVVAGAGHNSLITAAYLAKAGYECLVLDARAIPGGGAATEELLGPGYRIDSCSTGHTIIRVNPLLHERRARPHADYGLEYLEPDPVGHVAFPDGEQLTMWLDLDRTCDEIARFSRRDAEAYRRLHRRVRRGQGRSSAVRGSRRPASARRSRRCCSSTRAGASGCAATRSAHGT